MREELLDLLKKEAFFKKKVILSSGKESDYYIDVRRVSLSSSGIYLISHLIWDLIQAEDIQAIGGPTLGADPIVGGVCFLARTKDKPLWGFLVRKESKKHGQRQMIEGRDLKPGERVVLIDDVATSGSSLVKAIDILRDEGVEIKRVIVVVDRDEGAREAIETKACQFLSLFTIKDFLS